MNGEPVPAVPADGISPAVVSRIRTAVPLAVGAAVTWLDHELAARYGWAPKIDTATAATVVTFAVSYAYYEAVRRLEAWRPALGKLLGYPAQPTY